MSHSTPRSGSARGWPSLHKQLEDVDAPAGSGLEQLITENQDLELLHSSEVDDGQPYPPWLRVRWRKAHPEEFPPGEAVVYPMMLERVLEWMEHNPHKVDPTLPVSAGDDARDSSEGQSQ
jgi:hypothetical protein